MARRIEVELTSSRDDGRWTWRAAGAKQPKGELDGSLLYPDAKVGDVVRADADFHIDGIDVVAVLPPKGARKEKPTLEILGSGKEEQLVTTQLAPKGRGGGRGRDRDGGGRGDRDGRGGGRGRDGGRDNRDGRGGGRSGGGDRSGPRRDTPDRPQAPKPKKLRPGKVHRSAWLESLPPEHQPIGEQFNRGGGLPQIRQALEQQSEQAVKDGQPAINPAPLLALAEQLLPGYRAAEWRDRAEAAMADLEELDLRDLRSVVGASDAAARTDETREMAETLRSALTRRVDEDHTKWLAELADVLSEGRVVRALRLSSRPPKAGAPLPADISSRLITGAAASLTTDTSQDRWATVLNAIAFSPVRQQVKPEGLPTEPNETLLAEVTKLSTRTPEIAALFGIQPTEMSRKRRPRKGGKKPAQGRSGSPAKAAPEKDGKAHTEQNNDSGAPSDATSEQGVAPTPAAESTPTKPAAAPAPPQSAQPSSTEAPAPAPADAATTADSTPAPPEPAPGVAEAATPAQTPAADPASPPAPAVTAATPLDSTVDPGTPPDSAEAVPATSADPALDPSSGSETQ